MVDFMNRFPDTLGVACQEDVFRVEDPFLISIADVSRAHFYAGAVRDVYVRLPDEDPKGKGASCMGKIYERRCTDLWMLLNGGRTLHPGLDGGRIFPKACRPTSWCTVTIFSLWADARGESIH